MNPTGEVIFPLTFATKRASAAAEVYLRDPPLRKLVEFFETKGLAAIKAEDQSQTWHDDWIAYQAAHRLYASVISTREYSTLGNEFDLLRLTRFLEVFAYFSPAHGYSLQVSFLGLFAILMGTNAALKREAVAALEAGGLLAFGVSEKHHGSDLLGNELTVTATAPGRFVAAGSKYYIGNANSASIIAVLGRRGSGNSSGASKRAPPILFALRPKKSEGFGNVRKIRTLGVRSAYVGAFDLKDHEFPQTDVLAEGRDAWEAVLGTVTLGKFFLGFGSIGICERALEESIDHLTRRILYGKPVIAMPHIASLVSQAYARLTAMKLYAYRALDYVQAASADDRRYLLFNAVQKAKVSTEGVKVIALLCECVGAWGFESENFFEMALRDIQLIPGLEGSTHINLALTSQFIGRYFNQPSAELPTPASLAAGNLESKENPYLMQARGGSIHSIAFPPCLKAYRPWSTVPNVRRFVKQIKAFGNFVKAGSPADAQTLGKCLATIAYGQLVAENCEVFQVPAPIVSALFHCLVGDLSAAAFSIASWPGLEIRSRKLIRHAIVVPHTTAEEWDFVLNRASAQGANFSRS